MDLEAHHLGTLAADALLNVLRFHDKTISSLNEAYQERIQQTVATLWPLRTRARHLEMAYLEIASEAAVTCVEMFNEKNPAQQMNLLWVYRCVQNLLSLRLIPESLGDGTVARLQDTRVTAAQEQQQNHQNGDGYENEEHEQEQEPAGARGGSNPLFNSSLTWVDLSGSPAAWSDSDEEDDDDDQDSNDDDDDDDDDDIDMEEGEAEREEEEEEEEEENWNEVDDYHTPFLGDDDAVGMDGLDYGPLIRPLKTMPAMAPRTTMVAAAGAIKRKEPKTPWTDEDIKCMVRLKDYEGLTHEEVATRIGRGKGSVENKYGRVVKEDKWKQYAETCRRDAARHHARAPTSLVKTSTIPGARKRRSPGQEGELERGDDGGDDGGDDDDVVNVEKYGRDGRLLKKTIQMV